VDLKIHVGKPDIDARESILRAQLADREHELSDETIADLAAATDGGVAADLEQLVNRAAKNVLSRGGDTIYRSDFD
jgi:SpoVK/Ycf46/Vps4 family AAA+-type ATPase